MRPASGAGVHVFGRDLGEKSGRERFASIVFVNGVIAPKGWKKAETRTNGRDTSSETLVGNLRKGLNRCLQIERTHQKKELIDLVPSRL